MKRSHAIWAIIGILALAVVYLFAGSSLAGRGISTEVGQATLLIPSAEVDPEDRWYSVYFTDPHGEEAQDFHGGLDVFLAEAIRQARLSVDLAVYELNLWSVRNALVDAHRNGVVVRVVTDSDQLGGEEMQALVAAGIPIVGDRQKSLMHNKFLIIDRREVWTGSMNLTFSSVYESNNNLLRVRSTELAENYLAEFEEMFSESRFGSGSPINTEYPVVNVEGTHIETYFSPEDGTQRRLLELIRDAQSSIFFLAYSFTSDEIAEALIERAQAGVYVSGVVDESQARTNAGAEYEGLRDRGLDVFLDGNPEKMHHKVLLIDDEVVVTGSYNFSASAEERNDENTVILHDLDIARLYRAEFEEVLVEAKK